MSKTHGPLLPTASVGTLEIVTFFVGGQRCAMEARQVRASRPLSCDDHERCQAIETLLGLPEGDKDGSTRQVLTIRLPEAEIDLSVSTPVELRKIELEAIRPLPYLIAARTNLRGLCALALETEGLILIFDLRGYGERTLLAANATPTP